MQRTERGTDSCLIFKDRVRFIGIKCTVHRTGRGTPGGTGTGGPAHIAAQNR